MTIRWKIGLFLSIFLAGLAVAGERLFKECKIIPDSWNGIAYISEMDMVAASRPTNPSEEEYFYLWYGRMINEKNLKEITQNLNQNLMDSDFSREESVKFQKYKVLLRNDMPVFKAGMKTIFEAQKENPSRILFLGNGIIKTYIIKETFEREHQSLPKTQESGKEIIYKKERHGYYEFFIKDTIEYEHFIHLSCILRADPSENCFLTDFERNLICLLSWKVYKNYWEYDPNLIDKISVRITQKTNDFSRFIGESIYDPTQRMMYEVLEFHPEDPARNRFKRRPEELEKAWAAFSERWEAGHPDPDLAPERLRALRTPSAEPSAVP